jgi:hypothetical protein
MGELPEVLWGGGCMDFIGMRRGLRNLNATQAITRDNSAASEEKNSISMNSEPGNQLGITTSLYHSGG